MVWEWRQERDTGPTICMACTSTEINDTVSAADGPRLMIMIMDRESREREKQKKVNN